MIDRFELIEDHLGRLTLRRPGLDDVADVRVRRSFPWTSPRHYVSLRTPEGAELLLLEDLDRVPQPARGVIERWLSRHSFIPKITRIDHVDARFGYQNWRVQTDRGPAEFRVQEREDIRFLSDGRFSIRDADGTVYELASLQSLDNESRRAVESLL
jgi:hypothetical protein